MVVSELLCVAGETDEARTTWLRARRAIPTEATLDRAALAARVYPPEADHVLRDVARAIAGAESKIIRVDLGDLGLLPRDRISPRSGHPIRALLDRLARQLGAGDVELAISTRTDRTHVVALEDPWVVVPASLVTASEPRILGSLARAVARIALGMPWLAELPVARAQALLVGTARHIVPGYAPDLEPEAASLAVQLTPVVARSLPRRNRKLLEDLAAAPRRAPGAPPALFVDFLGALMKAEVRAAFLVTGDMLSLLDDLAVSDGQLRAALASPGPQGLANVLQHPIASDLVRFALTRPRRPRLRRRAGATWQKA